jgi:hypothetical protein
MVAEVGTSFRSGPRIFPTLQQLLQIAEQEIVVEAALVRLVDDDRVLLAQVPVALRFGEQDAVSHELDVGARADLVGKADLVADRPAEFGLQFLRDAPRLSVADEFRHVTSEFEQNFRQLRGLARVGLGQAARRSSSSAAE